MCPFTISSGNASELFLSLFQKFNFPLFCTSRCEDVYSGYVSLHTAQHLCAGRLDGGGGSCIGKRFIDFSHLFI